MEEINKEEISKNSEIKTTEIREESSTNTGSEKREFRPRNPRPPRAQNSEQNQENRNNSEQNQEKRAPFKKKKPNNKPRFINKDIPTAGDGWTNDLKKAYMINEKIHKDRLNPHYKLNLNTNAKLRITPLGGLNEIGGNMMVVETENEAIIVDVGMSFPDGDMHGVDILIPDFTYLREIKDKIVAVIITHGHEDHIGAMPYLFKEMQFPIYGSPLPLEMIGSKFDEHKMISP